MTTIICATDFTDSSENATNYCNELAQLFQARIILFHSIQSSASDLSAGGKNAAHEQLANELEEREEYIRKLEAVKMRLNYGNPAGIVTFDSVVQHGMVKDTLPELIRKEKVDLVVIGNDDANSLQDIFIGTVAADIIAGSTCPVLIITKSTNFTPIRKIVIASDIRASPFTDLNFTLRLASIFSSEIMVLHILTANIPQAKELAIDELSRYYKSIPYKNLSLHVENCPYIEEGISNFIRVNKADMLVVGYHQRNVWQHLFPEEHKPALAYHTYLPLLILHQSK